MKLYLHFEGTPDFTYKLTTDSQIQTIQHLHQVLLSNVFVDIHRTL